MISLIRELKTKMLAREVMIEYRSGGATGASRRFDYLKTRHKLCDRQETALRARVVELIASEL